MKNVNMCLNGRVKLCRKLSKKEIKQPNTQTNKVSSFKPFLTNTII